MWPKQDVDREGRIEVQDRGRRETEGISVGLPSDFRRLVWMVGWWLGSSRVVRREMNGGGGGLEDR